MNNLNIEFLAEENIYDAEAQIRDQCLCTKEVKKIGNVVHCLLHIIMCIIHIWYGIKFKSFAFDNPLTITNIGLRRGSVPKLHPLYNNRLKGKSISMKGTVPKNDKGKKESLFMLRNLSQQEIEKLNHQ